MKPIQAISTNSQSARPAVVYSRVSSDKQQREGDGLRSQERACRDYAAREGFQVLASFQDVMSGKHASRPGLEQLLTFVRKHNKLHPVVIIDDISRLARDLMSYLILRNEIAEAGGELKSPKMNFSDDPTAQLPEKMMAVIVEHERIANANRSAERMKARLLNGYWPFPAPSGYTFGNDRARGGRVLVRKEPMASILAEALRLHATGRLETQAEVKRFLDGHADYPKGKSGEVPKQRIKALLENPIYAGLIGFPEWGVPYAKGQHEPLVSLETHHRIKQRLEGRPVFPVRKTLNEDFPLRGFVCCDDCGEPYRGAWSKGRQKHYGYYVCQTKGCDSYGKSARKEDVEGRFEELLDSLTPRPELIKVGTRIFRTLWDKHCKGFEERRAAAGEALRAVEAQMQGVITRAVNATQPTLIAAYETEIGRLESQRAIEAEKLACISSENGIELPDFDTAYRTVLRFIANPCDLWRSGRIECRRAAAKLVFGARLRYCRNEGYRTAETSMPIRLFGDLTTQGSSMVRAAGLEPARSFDRQIFIPGYDFRRRRR